MNLDLHIQNVLKRSEMENAMHGVMDSYGGQYQLTAYSESAKLAEQVWGVPIGVAAPNSLSRPSTSATKTMRQAESSQSSPLDETIGAGYRLTYSPEDNSWKLFVVTPEEGSLAKFWNQLTGRTPESERISIQKSGVYAENRFLTELEYRKDISARNKQIIISTVVDHSKSEFTTPYELTKDSSFGPPVNVAYAETIQGPFGDSLATTKQLEMKRAGSQPVSNFNRAPVNLSSPHARSVNTDMGAFYTPQPLSRAQAGLVHDALGNPSNKHFIPGVNVPASAVSRHTSGRSL
jgi:hypothetical protein